MTVYHYLRDGTQVDSVRGLVAKYEDCPEVYHIIDRINKRLAKERVAIHNKEAKKHAEQHQPDR